MPNKVTLAEDLECERLPDGACTVLPAGTNVEQITGPFIATRSDFFVINADGVVYRSRVRPHWLEDDTSDVPAASQGDILTIDSPFDILRVLQQEIGSAASAVIVLEQVYTSDRGKDALTRAASGFFAVTSLSVQRDTFLTLARLTDDATMGKHCNVSMQRLLAAMAFAGIGGDLQPYRSELAAARQAAKGIRDWRDKYIAHNDLAEAFAAVPLSTLSIAVVRDVVSRLGRLFETLSPLVRPGWSSNPSEVLLEGDGNQLLGIVEAGLPADSDDEDED